MIHTSKLFASILVLTKREEKKIDGRVDLFICECKHVYLVTYQLTCM